MKSKSIYFPYFNPLTIVSGLIRDHQQSWWYDEAPSKGAKVIDWKYKFEINVINSRTAYPPLYKGGPGGIYCNDFKIPLNRLSDS